MIEFSAQDETKDPQSLTAVTGQINSDSWTQSDFVLTMERNKAFGMF